MILNDVKIAGRVYKYNEFTTSKGKTIARFGLQFYNGKNAEGKSQYTFVDCKGFKSFGLNEKDDVIVFGHLGGEEWTDKQGSKRSRVCLLVESVDSQNDEKFIEEHKISDNPFV